MSKKKEIILPSDTISNFLNWIDAITISYKNSYDAVNDEDRMLQDFLHELEFAATVSERNKVADTFQQSRKRRRNAKDNRLMVEEIVKFFEDKQNKDCLNRMRQLLGKQRKQEALLKGERKYNPRVKIEG